MKPLIPTKKNYGTLGQKTLLSLMPEFLMSFDAWDVPKLILNRFWDESFIISHFCSYFSSCWFWEIYLQIEGSNISWRPNGEPPPE